MSFYKHHVFFCTNQRANGELCCEQGDATSLRAYAKQKIKELGLSGKGKVRINTSGCLDRCSEGPVMVIYPEEVWYTFIDQQDVDEIIDQHLQKGLIVERLKLK
jgi:(2Fe-2S) ferredoxin